MKDALVVLGGGVGADGKISPASKSRIEKAIEAFNAGYANCLIFSGKASFSKNPTPIKTEAQTMKERALALGVPAEKILLEEESQDTIGNAYFVKTKFLEPNHWRDIGVVTSEYHLPRAKYIFEKVLGQEYKIDFISAASDFLTKEELKNKEVREKAKLSIVSVWLNFVNPKDNKSLKSMLFRKHPAYSTQPTTAPEEYGSLTDILTEV